MKILWAIDIHPRSYCLNRTVVRILEMFLSGDKNEVEPVYVYRPFLSLPGEAFQDAGGPALSEARMAVTRVLRAVSLPRMLPAQFLPQESGGHSGRVATLLRYARDSKASCILLTKRQRRGIRAHLRHGFADTLTFRCEIPMLIITHRSHAPEKFSEVLFATDLSPQCFQGYRLLIPLARSLGVPVRLFYHARVADEYASTNGVDTKVKRVVLEDLNERRRQMAEWREFGREEGVVATEELEQESAPLVESVIAVANRLESPLLALVSQHGPLGSFLFGKGTHELIRISPFPIWVTHLPFSHSQMHEPMGALKAR